jgi:hypothetical protein
VRVTANEKMSVFFRHVPVTLAAGEEVSGELAAFLLRSAPKKVTRSDSDPEAPPAELDITASAQHVLAWVGDDPERAAEALVAEEEKDKPRSTLVKSLEKLAGLGEE